MPTQTAKIKNGALVLPRSWKRADVFVLPLEDTLIVKKLSRPARKISEIASLVKLPKLTAREIQKEIETYRRKK
ncbi:MAG: hypothetical protein HY609_02080 [Deltaproteobacteria bacterium]|nr:hypothetical protein [Deltaproteobacteria bacterium]